MTEDPNYLIVYGTLRPAFANPFSQFLRQHGQYLGEATFPGLLFDAGGYPGAAYQPDSPTRVTGTVYDISVHKRMILTYLDEYENVGSAFSQPNEYVRTLMPTRYHQNQLSCWVYLYNWPTAERTRIPSGDYVRYSMNE